jgi:glycerol-3-phosphate dehydrogenase
VNHLVICNAEDKRSIFVIPRGDTVYIGTTDTSYHGDRPLWPEVEADDVRATWSGVRPLIAQDSKGSKDKDPKELSRKDEVTVGPGGMVSIAGGKLTGFRRLAEDVIRVVEKQLGRRLPEGPGTATVPGGEISAPSALKGLTEGQAERLHRLYGSEADAVVALGSGPLVEGGTVLRGEVDWAIDVEAAVTVEDVVYRRTRAAWFVPAERDELAIVVADRMATLLGWDTARRDEQLADVQSRFADELTFRNGDLT